MTRRSLFDMLAMTLVLRPATALASLLAPKIKHTTLSAAPADSPTTIFIASGGQGYEFDESCWVPKIEPPIIPTVAIDNETGISIRFVKRWDIKQDVYCNRLDVESAQWQREYNRLDSLRAEKVGSHVATKVEP